MRSLETVTDFARIIIQNQQFRKNTKYLESRKRFVKTDITPNLSQRECHPQTLTNPTKENSKNQNLKKIRNTVKPS